ncbi:hypothetical protein [Tautonia marina]|uniref:hypothetical protein n=1 Tax=Tautonia marina TaxID=2653855 RepID=UPI001261198F|nr:hypothetical protein [Tautonia marina]
MSPKFSLEECLKRYLYDLNARLYLESTSPPVPESHKEWLAEIVTQQEDIRCVQYWLARVQSGEVI